MSVRRAWHAVANETGEVARNLRRADKAAANLEKRGGSGGGSGGATGGTGPQFQASSVAPSGAGVAPAGGANGARLGGSGSTGAEGVKAPEGRRGDLAAIIEAAGVAAPPRDAWAPNGLTDAPPGFIVATVLSLGTSAPVNFLIWCAGLLAYTNVDDLAATAGRHGGGFNGNPMSGKRSPGWGDFNFAGPSRVPWTERNSGWGNFNYAGDARPSYTGQVTGTPTSQGMSSSQARSIETSSQQSANLLGTVANTLKSIDASLKAGAGGVGVRAGKG